MRFTEQGGWWVVAQMVLIGLLAALWWIWSADWGMPAVAGGLGVALAGAVQAISGMAVLGGNLTPYPSPRDSSALIESGPYRLVRHPIYGGLAMGSAGLSLADGNPGALTVSLGLLVLFVGKSRFEEERLLARFPAYRDYRRRVPHRFIPWLL